MALPNLPKPMSQRPTGMPQMRRKSGLRTASGNLQEAFLERVRAIRDDPTDPLNLPLTELADWVREYTSTHPQETAGYVSAWDSAQVRDFEPRPV